MASLDQLGADLSGVTMRLRELGDTGLQRRLSAAIGKAVEPVEQEVRDGLDSHMPDGYAQVIASELDVFRRTWNAPGESRVTVYATTRGRGRKLRRLEAGTLWHPLFGRWRRRDKRNQWFEMGEPHVKAGFFGDAAAKVAPRAREQIEQALNDIIAEAVKK